MTLIKVRRVLIVEDHEDSACMFAEMLRERGHEVRVAHDATDGLAAASDQKQGLDVVVLDIGLPGMDGYELAQRMRALPNLRSACRFVALTGYAGAEHESLSRNAGFDAHLIKPVSPDLLVQAVER